MKHHSHIHFRKKFTIPQNREMRCYHHRNNSNTTRESSMAQAEKPSGQSIVLHRTRSLLFLEKQLPYLISEAKPIRKNLQQVRRQISVQRPGKLSRWRRSHHRWLLEFKWRWQKPWSLSEVIRQSDHIAPRTWPLPHRSK